MATEANVNELPAAPAKPNHDALQRRAKDVALARDVLRYALARPELITPIVDGADPTAISERLVLEYFGVDPDGIQAEAAAIGDWLKEVHKSIHGQAVSQVFVGDGGRSEAEATATEGNGSSNG